jgi:hypothetical protein
MEEKLKKALKEWLKTCKSREQFLQNCLRVYGLVEINDIEVVWDSAYRVAFVRIGGNIHSIYPNAEKVLKVA